MDPTLERSATLAPVRTLRGGAGYEPLVLTKTHPGWLPDLGLLSLQSCEKQVSVVSNPGVCKWYFVTAAQTG